ncbi:hypothetical protein D9757_005481 [Collybiopsis confluens]|uniref:Glycoside hydrolase 131 catalytic N-terminal domain-containing protein n=1 Tax=Collybiopsis confluens TaxID=2823264 RepID=A0A8H5HM88_9AGAR|nr:hypothetical protein D9757_005481 [Collybiopsis confluens]
MPEPPYGRAASMPFLTEVGTYQWYIHGTQPTSHYLALSPSYKNPADTAETNGLMVTIDSTATWNSNMERTELIPQTSQNLGTGNLFYHFSLSTDPRGVNTPDSTLEHQILFFESHFTEIKYGVAPTPTNLQWMVSSQYRWGTPLVPGTWYNFAYDIDFSAQTVGLWFSTGGSPLTKVASNVAASTSTNSEDFHVGVLRIVNTPAPENWYISGVYIESGPITTAIGNGSGSGSSSRLKLTKAYTYLNDVTEHKQVIPFRRFAGGVGRASQAKQFGTTQGRWPEKSVKFIVRLLKNAESNADAKNLDVEDLFIKNIVVQQAPKTRRRTYRAHGRINPYQGHPCHVEIILATSGEEVEKSTDKPNALIGLNRRQIARKRIEAGRA